MTKVATIDMRRVLHLVVIAAMVIAMLLVALMPKTASAATEGSAGGHFHLNNAAPTVDSVALYEHDDNNTALTMDPTVEYIVRVGITDTNQLNDLDKIQVTVYYDADGIYDVGNVLSAGDDQNGAILTWDSTGTDNWTIDDGSSSWDIETDSVAPADLSAVSTFTFKFHFTVGSVAKESADGGDAAEWHIYAKVWDLSNATGDNYQENREMDWYGAITVSGTVDFGSVNVGVTDQISGGGTTGVTCTYVSNGAFDEQVKADTPWVGATSGKNLALNTGGTPGDAQFSLHADDTATVGGAVQVSASYQTIDDTGTITDENGHAQANNFLWLSLGSTGIPDETYNGTIWYQIANGT
jgi:hypothetical protein